MDSNNHASAESTTSTRCPTPNSSISATSKTAPSTPLSSSNSSDTSSRDDDFVSQNGLGNYISLGCLHHDLSTSLMPSTPTTGWFEIALSRLLQFSSIIGSDAIKLLRAGWVRLFFQSGASESSRFIISRVFLRPLDSFADRENKPLKSQLRSLLQRIDVSQEAWAGQLHLSIKRQDFDPWATGEDESLFYIFNTIPSPDPNPEVITCPYSAQAVEDLVNSANREEKDRTVKGLKTKLYHFQTKSAALMIQKESTPQKVLDPRFEPRYGPDHRLFYYNPRDTEFILNPQYFDSNRGGILAETMGIGKTLICLAVILATKDHLPYIPPRYQGGTRVWGRLSSAGEIVRTGQISSETLPLTAMPPRNSSTITFYGVDNFWEVGTLAKMAAAAAARNSIPWKLNDHIAERAECLKVLDAAVPSYDVPIEQARKNRSNLTNVAQKRTLCSGTLIVVPPNLLTQWQSEVKKHVVDGALKVLVLDNNYSGQKPGEEVGKEPEHIFCTKWLPPADVLRNYDIVLFSRPRFEQEIKDGADINGRRLFTGVPTLCQCPYIGATRTPDCQCFRLDQTYRSPLKELHWLRMIIDEGHNFSSAKSNAVLIAGQIKADRRWVVSGTPAKDLVGVDVELPVADAQEVNSREAVMEKRRHFSESDDMKAAAKSLGDLAKNFLKVQPWTDCTWEDYMYRHESNTHRTYTCLSACMKQTLVGLVIKTTPDIYEKEVSIPDLTHTTVRLKPSWFDKMSANLFIQVLRANAITSERTDVDYLFHKNSVKARHSLLRNLRQSNLTWTGFTENQIHDTLNLSQKYLDDPETHPPQEDIDMLKESMRMAEQVLESPYWLGLSRTHEIGLFVEDWPHESVESFSLGGMGPPRMIGVTQLVEGQLYVNSQISADDPASGLTLVGESAKAKAEEAEIDGEENAVKRRTSKSSEADLSKTGVPISCLDGEPTVGKRILPIRPNQSPRKSSKGSQNIKAPTTPGNLGEVKSPTKKRKLTLSDKTMELPTGSPLLQTSVIGTTSSKLSYVIDRVMQFQDEHKIIIFYDGDNAAYYISQALDFLHVGHRIYARTLESRTRDKYIQLFKESQNIRVLLMDVACGSHGLDLHVASVVLIINPINRKDVEAQAIKRAHRIGQTKKVLVETLILEGTIEEAIFDAVNERTRNMRQDDELQKAKTIEDDKQIQEIIQNAKIIPVAPSEAEGYAQLARLQQRQQVFARPNRAKYDGALENKWGEEAAEKRRKRRRKGAERKDEAVEQPQQTPATVPLVRGAEAFTPAASSSISADTPTGFHSLFGGPAQVSG